MIFRMVAENPNWGAPRIHGELCKLGFEVSERTVSRWIKRTTRCPDLAPALARVSSKTSRSNRCHGFFHCADADLRGLLLFLSHRPRRRKILHCNVTRHPNALWIGLQSRETWRCDQPHRFLIFDRDAKFCADVVWTVNRVSVRFKAIKLLLSPGAIPAKLDLTLYCNHKNPQPKAVRFSLLVNHSSWVTDLTVHWRAAHRRPPLIIVRKVRR